MELKKSQLRIKAESLECPICHAKAGEDCIMYFTGKIYPISRMHKERYILAQEK